MVGFRRQCDNVLAPSALVVAAALVAGVTAWWVYHFAYPGGINRAKPRQTRYNALHGDFLGGVVYLYSPGAKLIVGGLKCATRQTAILHSSSGYSKAPQKPRQGDFNGAVKGFWAEGNVTVR